jgi:hypothetical protein
VDSKLFASVAALSLASSAMVDCAHSAVDVATHESGAGLKAYWHWHAFSSLKII